MPKCPLLQWARGKGGRIEIVGLRASWWLWRGFYAMLSTDSRVRSRDVITTKVYV
jgi:hypothetical protein